MSKYKVLPDGRVKENGKYVGTAQELIDSLFEQLEEKAAHITKLIRQPTLKDEEIQYPRDIFRSLIDNNSPYAWYLFQWVPYQTVAKKWRLKMLHDAKAFDGRVVHCEWPNADRIGDLHDDEIEFVRISKEQFRGPWVDPR